MGSLKARPTPSMSPIWHWSDAGSGDCGPKTCQERPIANGDGGDRNPGTVIPPLPGVHSPAARPKATALASLQRPSMSDGLAPFVPRVHFGLGRRDRIVVMFIPVLFDQDVETGVIGVGRRRQAGFGLAC